MDTWKAKLNLTDEQMRVIRAWKEEVEAEAARLDMHDSRRNRLLSRAITLNRVMYADDLSRDEREYTLLN